ncbi:hypothetical protein HMPREF9520_00894 [Enterococcus faecalis TX1467]|nr:hypothetical protein HMPREF9520_00894 [Enterococcus faecalis TX1467]
MQRGNINWGCRRYTKNRGINVDAKDCLEAAELLGKRQRCSMIRLICKQVIL